MRSHLAHQANLVFNGTMEQPQEVLERKLAVRLATRLSQQVQQPHYAAHSQAQLHLALNRHQAQRI